MKTQEEIVIQAKAYAESIGNEDGTSAYDYVMGYTQCQEDMTRKEIQPEDIWNDEKLNMVKEHILNHIKNQTLEDIAETELVAKKYAEEDMADKKYTELQLRFFADELIKGVEEKNKQGYEDIKVDYESLILSLNKQD